MLTGQRLKARKRGRCLSRPRAPSLSVRSRTRRARLRKEEERALIPRNVRRCELSIIFYYLNVNLYSFRAGIAPPFAAALPETGLRLPPPAGRGGGLVRRDAALPAGIGAADPPSGPAVTSPAGSPRRGDPRVRRGCGGCGAVGGMAEAKRAAHGVLSPLSLAARRLWALADVRSRHRRLPPPRQTLRRSSTPRSLGTSSSRASRTSQTLSRCVLVDRAARRAAAAAAVLPPPAPILPPFFFSALAARGGALPVVRTAAAADAAAASGPSCHSRRPRLRC